jgi:hypothetical protein
MDPRSKAEQEARVRAGQPRSRRALAQEDADPASPAHCCLDSKHFLQVSFSQRKL